MSAAIQASTNDYLFATWKNVFIVLWRGQTTAEGVGVSQRVFNAHTKKCPDGVLLLTIVADGAPMPDSAARDAISQLLRSGSGKAKKSAVVYEGDGFRAAAVRSVVTGLSVFSKLPFPHKIFAKVSDAAGFLATETGSDVTSTELVTVIRDLRSADDDAR